MNLKLITVQLLIQCGLNPTQARAFERPLQHACERYQINTVRRFAAFMAQCAQESSDFTRLEENLYYSSHERIREVFKGRVPTEAMARSLVRNPQALANRVYASRGGNGNEASGEGWKYRGRGIIQLTLKDNYSLAAFNNSRPYVDNPDLVSSPPDAALTAAWYWSYFGCNQLADAWNIDQITRVINGSAMLGRLQRRQRCDKLLAILKDED